MVPRRILAISSVFVISLGVNPVNSQIIPDGTTETTILNNCQNSCDINGGVVAGQNLFHSFQEFNVSGGERVYFADPGVTNIFSRITGNNSSDIFGTLGVTGGNANLFLLNPNGIFFGEGASLDLNGSFFATTADEIQFGDLGWFSSNPDPTEDLALLTVNPSALFFNQTGQNGSIILEGANLDVSNQNDLTLLGKDVNTPGILLKNANINVFEGNITLGAVKENSTINIDDNLQLEFPQDVRTGDIELTETSSITSVNLRNIVPKKIEINAGNLEIIENSNIFTARLGNQPGNGAEIKINAQESVKIIGENSSNFQELIANNFTAGNNTDLAERNQDLTGSGLQTGTLGVGNAGDITISTPYLMIDNGGGIVSSTRNQGKSGNLTLTVADTFILRSSGLLTGSAPFTLGEVGEIQIDTGRLLVEQGSIISSSTLGNGDAGNLTVNASESVQIRDTPIDSVSTGIFTNTIFGHGNGGNLTVNTPELTLSNGGQLAASSGANSNIDLGNQGGKGGNIIINDAESIIVSGSSANGFIPSSIVTDTTTDQPAGNVTINTGSLLLSSQGLISASSIGTGTGGNITINAQGAVVVDGPGIGNLEELIVNGLTGILDLANAQGGIAAFTLQDGTAGNIEINASSLSLHNGAIISTATYGNDDAGKLDLTVAEMINVQGSVIIAPTFGAGDGGQLQLTTKDLNITEGGAIVSASLGSGNAGNLSVFAESIAISNTIPDLLFSGSISTGSYGGVGFSGDLNIHTERLAISNGANIEANNVALMALETTDNIPPRVITESSSLTIKASESIEIAGTADHSNLFNAVASNSHISSTTTTANPASNVFIETNKLSVLDHGEITVSSQGEGAAGKLEIIADSITLRNEGNLNGTTTSGQGGDILLKVQDNLRLSDNSVISTNAIDLGNGGNIEIFANFAIASGNSSISANAPAFGNGGMVNISANGLFLTADSTITANSEAGIDGTVEIKTSIDPERNNYTELPQQVIATESTIIQSCSSHNSLGVFSYTGRGGLPPNPLTEFQANDIVIADFDLPHDHIFEDQFIGKHQQHKILNIYSPRIVEADEWQVNPNGKVELIATANNGLFPNQFNPKICPLLMDNLTSK